MKCFFNPWYWGYLVLISIFCSSFTYSTTILVHGDSLAAGYGISPEEGWVSLLSSHYKDELKIINASISGETSRGGLVRLPGLLLEYTPDIVLLELGANDGLRGYPILQIRQNLQSMIDLAQNSGAQVILVGIRLPPNLGSRYADPFFENYSFLATKNDILHIPFLLEGVAQYSELMQPDGLHPTTEAQPIILENVIPVIQQAIKAE